MNRHPNPVCICCSEFIIDLMGAPGTLIPAEIPSSHLDDSVPSLLSSNISEQTAKDLCLALDKASSQFGKQNELVEGSTSNALSNVTLPRITDSQSNDTLTRIIGSQSEKISRAGPLLETGDGGISDMVQTEKFETEFTSLLPSLGGMQLDTFGAKETMSSAQQMQVDDVSKYVVSAAKDPEFAQKLHAVLSENAALPPDSFAGLNPRQEPIEQKNLGKSIFCKQSHADKEEQLPVCSFLLHPQPSLLPITGAETSSCVYGGNKQQNWDVEMNHLQIATVDHVSNLTAGGIHSTLATSDAILSIDTGSKGMSLCKLRAKQTSPFLETQGLSSDSGRKGACESSLLVRANICQEQVPSAPKVVAEWSQENAVRGNILVQDCQESAKDSMGLFVGMGNNELNVLSPVDNEKMNPMLGSVAEYEIPWEDLQIGERIGLGGYKYEVEIIAFRDYII